MLKLEISSNGLSKWNFSIHRYPDERFTIINFSGSLIETLGTMCKNDRDLSDCSFFIDRDVEIYFDKDFKVLLSIIQRVLPAETYAPIEEYLTKPLALTSNLTLFLKL